MIGEIRTREPAAGGFHIERQHPAVPSLIFLHEILETIAPACLHVGSFKRVVDEVEPQAVTENFEIFQVAASAGFLGALELTTAQCAGYGPGAALGGAGARTFGGDSGRAAGR